MLGKVEEKKEKKRRTDSQITFPSFLSSVLPGSHHNMFEILVVPLLRDYLQTSSSGLNCFWGRRSSRVRRAHIYPNCVRQRRNRTEKEEEKNTSWWLWEPQIGGALSISRHKPSVGPVPLAAQAPGDAHYDHHIFFFCLPHQTPFGPLNFTTLVGPRPLFEG